MTVRYDFTGRVAVVTGGARGIGRRIAERLRDAGAVVEVWDVAAVAIPGIAAAPVDVTSETAVAAAAAALEARHGRLDILVANAGWGGPTRTVEETIPEDWRRIVEINLTGTYLVCRATLPLLRRAPAGRIVCMASLAGKEGTPRFAAYSAAKAGVIALTKALGKELADTAVRVNAIAPAAVETELLAQFSPDFVATMVAKSPLGRLGTVDEVADLTLWLASETCSFSTGAVFDLSGGRATY